MPADSPSVSPTPATLICGECDHDHLGLKQCGVCSCQTPVHVAKRPPSVSPQREPTTRRCVCDPTGACAKDDGRSLGLLPGEHCRLDELLSRPAPSPTVEPPPLTIAEQFAALGWNIDSIEAAANELERLSAGWRAQVGMGEPNVYGLLTAAVGRISELLDCYACISGDCPHQKWADCEAALIYDVSRAILADPAYAEAITPKDGGSHA